MVSGEWSKQFDRTSTSTRPPQQALDALPEGVREIISAGVAAPLDRDEHERLVENLQVVKRWIRYYWANGDDITRIAPASNLNSAIGTIFGQFAPQQKPLLRQLVMEQLMLDSFASGGSERTYWTWLQLLVIGQPLFTATVQTLLGITAEGGSDQLRSYRYKMSLGGLSGDAVFGLGIMAGTFEIEYLGDDPDAAKNTEPVWRRELWMSIAQASLGASVGSTVGLFTPWSTFQTPYPYEPQNFKGKLLIGGVQTSASLVAGGGGGAAIMTVFGDGLLPWLVLTGASPLVEFGEHAGAEVGGTVGLIGGSDSVMERPSAVRGESSLSARASTHFEVDDPHLTADGLDAIRQMAALQLTSLEDPGAQLSIDAYASRTGSDEYNLKLSKSRARHVLQAIKDVVPGFAVPAAQIDCPEHGEAAAREAGDEDRTENPEWRRADIVLNGTLVLSLH